MRVTRENDIEALLSVNIDYIGFNFIKSSPRVSIDWALNMSRKYNLQINLHACLKIQQTMILQRY